MSNIKNDMRRVFLDLSWADRLFPLLIILAIVTGVLLSVYVPRSRDALNSVEVVGVSVPLAVGLIVMLLPPLCKIEWENLGSHILRPTQLKSILYSLALNWIVCPFLMFGLAWLTLFDEAEYRTGIIMIGLARCIAMVLIWNDLANGDSTLCAIVVLVNSMLQMVLYAPYQIFFCYVITGDYHSTSSSVTYSMVAKSVAFFMGIPFCLGLIIRVVGRRALGPERYDKRLVPLVSPWALIGLLYTIIVIFMEKGHDFIKEIGSAFRCFVPLILYFLITFFGTLFLLRWLYTFESFEGTHQTLEGTEEEKEKLCGCEKMKTLKPENLKFGCRAPYATTITHAFTAASNNFELSLAIAISIYGSGSKEAIAATFGPLIEVPVLLLLVFVARYFRIRFLWIDIGNEDEEFVEC